MRIAFVVAGGVDPGGVRRVVPELLDLLGELARRHDVHVVALRQFPHPGRWRLAGADVYNVGARPRRLRALLHLVKEHRTAPFDVIVGYALVPQGVVAAVAGALLDVPYVVAGPGGDFTSLPDIDFGGWRNVRGRFWVRLACRRAAAVLVPSTPSSELAGTRGITARRIPLPLSLDAWPLRKPRPGVARLAWVGSQNRVKWPELLVDTIAHLHAQGVRVSVDVVGEDLRAGAVEEQVAAAGLDAWFTFHGHLEQRAVRAVLEGAGLVLVTSRFEGGCRVVLEAAAVGVPVVGTPVGYVAEWAPDAAVAADDASPESLGAAVRSLLEDPARHSAVAGRAQARLVEHEAARVAGLWEQLFTEIRAGGARG
jgi:glycosyltransferase involved in cell wall biosynthesis